MSNNKPKTEYYTKGSIEGRDIPEVSHLNHGTSHIARASSTNKRAGFNRHDFDVDRPNDRLPTDHKEIVAACQSVYRRVGMVRNIIDLMTDFAAEGLTLHHTVKTQERFFQEWAKRVDLQGRAHDFMKLLMRDANVIVRRKNAFITKPATKEMTKGDLTVVETKVTDKLEKIKTTKKTANRREIPWRYTFLSPTMIEKIGGEVGKFFGSDALGLRIPASLLNSIKNPKTDAERDWIKNLPPQIQRKKLSANLIYALDMDEIYVDYYKKDDWEDWGTPFLYGVLEDIMFKEKMRLADMAALDGVINVVRLWKLGKSDQQITPAPAIVDRLIGILQSNTGGGVMDLVWDDMIDLEVFYPPIDKILGAEKYISVNGDIVRGLGIPDSLVGGSDLGTRNAQSAFVQLKTLVERLEYVRSRAIKWMQGEMRLVADAMGFKKTAEIGFGNMSLRDEVAEKQLMVQLLDRNVVSSERVAEVFGVEYVIELERLKSEQEFRMENPGVAERSDPYNRPFSVMERQNDLDIKIEKVKQGFQRDSKFPNKGGDNMSGDQPKNEGKNPPGRPRNTKDTTVRDERTTKTLSTLNVVAAGFMDQIDELIDSTYLKQEGIKNMRSLTKAQRIELERTKRGLLSVLQPTDVVTKDLLVNRIGTSKSCDILMNRTFCCFVSEFTASTGKEPTTKERRMLAGMSWSNMFN